MRNLHFVRRECSLPGPFGVSYLWSTDIDATLARVELVLCVDRVVDHRFSLQFCHEKADIQMYSLTTQDEIGTALIAL